MIAWNGLTKSYGKIPVLRNMTGSVEPGDILILSGVSGAGKSTLLNILGLLERFDAGDIFWWGKKNVRPFSRDAERILATKIGYLFQNFALIEHQTVAENLEIAMIRVRVDKRERVARIRQALAKVGLDGYEEKRIFECSGGEQQRIAIARLLLKPCELILADEPTGSLDIENKKIILDLLIQLHTDGKTLVISTHDEEVKALATRIYPIKDLKKINPNPTPAEPGTPGWPAR